MARKHLRREFLAGGVTFSMLGFAGCASDSDPSSGADSEPQWEEILNDRTDIEEDGYQSWSWDIDQDTEVQWQMSVRQGPSIELFLMESTEFDEYQAGNRFYVVESETGTSGSDTFTLQEGNYRFVLDNTNAGEVEPPTNFEDDVAEVEIEAEARPV